MINGLRIDANEGGQQPSEMVCLANGEMTCAHMPPWAEFSRKYLAKRAEIVNILTGSGSQTESDVSYRKQRVGRFLTGARTAFKKTQFWPRSVRIFSAPQHMISGQMRRRRTAAETSREVVNCAALQHGDIQNLCGTIIFSAIERPHG